LIAYDPRRRLGFAASVGGVLALLSLLVVVSAAHTDPTIRVGPAAVGAAFAVGILSFAVVRWTLRRWQAAIAVGVLGGVLALAGSDPVATARLVTSFLGMLTMWAAPWAGVMLASRVGANARFDARAVSAWIVGILAGVPFWQQ